MYFWQLVETAILYEDDISPYGIRSSRQDPNKERAGANGSRLELIAISSHVDGDGCMARLRCVAMRCRIFMRGTLLHLQG